MSTNLIPKPPNELSKIISNAERELDQLQHTPFTDNAFERLKYKVGEDCVESIRIICSLA